jgi:hypothetical protein
VPEVHAGWPWVGSGLLPFGFCLLAFAFWLLALAFGFKFRRKGGPTKPHSGGILVLPTDTTSNQRAQSSAADRRGGETPARLRAALLAHETLTRSLRKSYGQVQLDLHLDEISIKGERQELFVRFRILQFLPER